MGAFAARSMSVANILPDIAFDIFTHVTTFMGYKVSKMHIYLFIYIHTFIVDNTFRWFCWAISPLPKCGLPIKHITGWADEVSAIKARTNVIFKIIVLRCIIQINLFQ